MTIPSITDLLKSVLPEERAPPPAPASAVGGGPDGERAPAARAAQAPDPLLAALDSALAGLEQALDDFAWPAVMTPSRLQRFMREYVHENWPEVWPGLFPGLAAAMRAVAQSDAPGGGPADDQPTDQGGDSVASPDDEVSARLEEDLRAIFTGPPPPGLAPILAGLAGDAQAVVMAYNRFRLLIVSSARRLRPELSEAWRSALMDRAADLSWLGVEEAGREKILWARRREFLAATARQPDRAYGLLAGDDGLVPAWRETARQVRRQGLATFLVSPGDDVASPMQDAGLLDVSG